MDAHVGANRGDIAEMVLYQLRSGQGTVQAVVDAYLAAPRCANPNTHRSYANVLGRVARELNPDRPLTTVHPQELADVLDRLWGQVARSTRRHHHGIVEAWLAWCARSRIPAPPRGRDEYVSPAVP